MTIEFDRLFNVQCDDAEVVLQKLPFLIKVEMRMQEE